MICQNCGATISDGTVFCEHCGAQVSAAAPQQPAYQQPVYQQPVYQQPQQPVYQQPVYQQPVYQKAPSVPGKGLGIASMVIGIVALALGICLGWVGVIASIVAIAMGGVGLNKAKAVGAKNGMAVAGLVCSIIALAFDIIWIVAIADAINTVNSYVYYY